MKTILLYLQFKNKNMFHIFDPLPKLFRTFVAKYNINGCAREHRY
jgi:hypothetical protein